MQIDTGIMANGCGVDGEYQLELVADEGSFRWLSSGDDTEVSGTAQECLNALEMFPGRAELDDESASRYSLLLSSAVPLYLQICGMRQREGERQLPQQRTYEELEQLEVELLELLADEGGSGEPWDELALRIDELEGELSSW